MTKSTQTQSVHPAAVAKDAEVSTSTPQDYRAASLRYET